ncbi:MAG: LamG domain-containing protein [Anaerolineae bacterium]|nr:LamG domain-containing protein [Anaerolineae bacterium]
MNSKNPLFSLRFENGFVSEQGAAGLGSTPRLAPGRTGQAALFQGKDTLAYRSEGHLNRERGRLTFWLKPQWPGRDGRDYIFFDIGDGFYNRLRVQKDGGNNLRFIVWGPRSENGLSYNVAHWQPDEWHQIGVTWEPQRIALYVDGKLRDTSPKVDLPDRLAAKFFVGSSSNGDHQANAVIDELLIFADADEETLQASPTPIDALTLPDQFVIPVLVVAYFPVIADRIDRRMTGDVGASVGHIRQHVQQTTQQVVEALERGSIYHGYKNPAAQPSLRYQIVETLEYMDPLPTYRKPGHRVPMADYNAVMNRVNIRHWVEARGVKEVWLWGYHGGVIDIWESNMAGPFGDISNSDRDRFDLPNLSQTYTVYHYNYGRGPSEAVEDHMHQIEAVLRDIDHRLFWEQFVGRPGEGRCGWAHFPPNGVRDYDWANPNFIWTDIEDWRPNGGEKKRLNCRRWNCDSLTWFIYWMQNLPGANNGLTYRDRPLTNWWTFIGDFDGAMRKRLGLVG